MTDPRPELRATYAHWLRVRGNVRALAASLVAAEHGLARDARRSGETDMAVLAAQLAKERTAIEAVRRDLDARIVVVKRECDAIEAAYRESLVEMAHLPRKATTRSLALPFSNALHVLTNRSRP